LGGKHFFVLHTQGSHEVYVDRYPANFNVFQQNANATDRERLVNAYDNTILYTDFVLSELIDFLARLPGTSALLYVADHGENLADDSRRLKGHFFNNKYDLPIAGVFWFSDSFASRYPARVSALMANARARVNTRAIFYTLADMAALTLQDPNMARLSLLSPTFEPPRREVFGAWGDGGQIKTVDYDADVLALAPQ
jgi:glucan phosphoethanolaminetransferase (alkaline phosphatase superfamily)